jgi:hypothetical protein
MKYLKMSLTIIVVLAIYFIYLFIPNRIILSGNDNFGKSANDAKLGILQIQYWDKWMPYKTIDTLNRRFYFENSRMDVQNAFISSAKSKFIVDDVEAILTFSAIDAGNDKTYVRYECIIENRGFSPMTRIHNYQASKKMEKELAVIIQAAKKHYTN